MKLYSTVKSEKGKAEGKGGQEYLDIEILNVNQIDNMKCDCTDPVCAKCLLVNCKDSNCKVHPKSKKKEFREMYKKR